MDAEDLLSKSTRIIAATASAPDASFATRLEVTGPFSACGISGHDQSEWEGGGFGILHSPHAGSRHPLLTAIALRTAGAFFAHRRVYAACLRPASQGRRVFL